MDDVPILYPSRDDLVNRLQKITNDIQLIVFIRGIKDDLHEVNQPDSNERISFDEIKKKELSELSKQLSRLEHTRPMYQIKDYNRSDLVQKLSAGLDDVMAAIFRKAILTPRLSMVRSIDLQENG